MRGGPLSAWLVAHFTPRGAVRKITSTADAGTATVTLRYGPGIAFPAACRALARSGQAG